MIVGLVEIKGSSRLLVDQHGRLIGADTGAGQPKITQDWPGLAPDREPLRRPARQGLVQSRNDGTEIRPGDDQGCR